MVVAAAMVFVLPVFAFAIVAIRALHVKMHPTHARIHPKFTAVLALLVSMVLVYGRQDAMR